MSLSSWFRWLLGGGSPLAAPQPLRLPTLPRAAGPVTTAKAAQGHWFMQAQRLSAPDLLRAWGQCAARAQQRWLVIDPLSRLYAADAQQGADADADGRGWLWRFCPNAPEDIAALLDALSGPAFDGVLLLDLERMRGLFGDTPDAPFPLWDAIRQAMARGVGVVQLQVLRWRGCATDDLIPMEQMLGARW